MFCTKCGTQLVEDSSFCTACGAPIEILQTAVSLPAPEAVAESVTSSGPSLVYQPSNTEETPVSAPVSYTAVQPPAKPKSKKVPLIIGITLAVFLVAGGIVGFLVWQENARSSTYDSGVAMLNAGQYSEALVLFTDLGDYKESKANATLAQLNLDLLLAFEQVTGGDLAGAKPVFERIITMTSDAAVQQNCLEALAYINGYELFEAQEYANAKLALEALGTVQKIPRDLVSELLNKCNYALAEADLTAGKNYLAYKAFIDLGSFSDAAARADACKIAFPATGEIYHNSDFLSSASSIKIDCSNVTNTHFYKVYAGDVLVAQLFINAGGVLEVEVPPGVYTIKTATGDMWWGPDDAYGSEGYYQIMTFAGDATTYELGDNRTVTITLNASGDGDSVGGKNTSLSDF